MDLNPNFERISINDLPWYVRLILRFQMMYQTPWYYGRRYHVKRWRGNWVHYRTEG